VISTAANRVRQPILRPAGFATALAIALVALAVGVARDSAATGQSSPTCPAVAGKMPSTPGAICGHELLQTRLGGPGIVALPPGTHPCPSVAGKMPSSPTASCTAGPRTGPGSGTGSHEVLSLPAGTSPCPSLPGKPSSPTSGCRGDATSP
jgi:hypothetical protein